MGCMGMQPGLSHHLAFQDWLIQSQLPLNLPNGAKIILGILPSFISKLLSNQLSRNGTEEVILKRFCPELESNPRPVRYPDFARLLHLCPCQLCHLGVKREAECKLPLPTYTDTLEVAVQAAISQLAPKPILKAPLSLVEREKLSPPRAHLSALFRPLLFPQHLLSEDPCGRGPILSLLRHG